nr:MAG TPA: hypothetical protein [Caudoviricetes sp.]
MILSYIIYGIPNIINGKLKNIYGKPLTTSRRKCIM